MQNPRHRTAVCVAPDPHMRLTTLAERYYRTHATPLRLGCPTHGVELPEVEGATWEGLQQQNQLKLIFTIPQVLSQELRSPDSLLLEAAAQMGAQRIFIDGISLLRTVSNQVNHTNGENGDGMGSYRQLLQLLLEGLQRENLTAILSHEVTAVEQQAFALEVTEFLCDTVIVLRREQHRRGTRRSLEIAKSRGQD